MNRSSMDFLRRPSPPMLGICLLAAGLVALGSAWWLNQRWAAEAAATQRAEQLVLATREASRPRPAPTTLTPAQRRELQAHAELRRPWLAALRAIESATRDPVFLLALAIEPATGAIRVDAEASNFDQALAYVERISEADVLTGTALIAHESVPAPAPGQGSIRFSVSTRWAMP